MIILQLSVTDNENAVYKNQHTLRGLCISLFCDEKILDSKMTYNTTHKLARLQYNWASVLSVQSVRQLRVENTADNYRYSN